MESVIKNGDAFIKKVNAGYYDVYYVKYVKGEKNQDFYFGDSHIISNRGVLTHFNMDITWDVKTAIPIPKSFYRLIGGMIDKAQLDAASMVFRVKHEKLKHLKEGS